MENYINNEYPYGEFPTKYTKNGQAELKQKWQEGNLNNEEKITANAHNATHQHQPANTIDIHKILPLIKKMNSNTPLSQGDMMGMLMGLIGKEHSDLVDVFSVIANTNIVKEVDVKSMSINNSSPSIDSYKKVE